MGLLLKALIGAFVVVAIGLLAKSKNYYIAGLLPLFPTFALIAHYLVATDKGSAAARHHHFRHVGDFALLSIFSRYGFYRHNASAARAGQRRAVLGAGRMVADYALDPLALTPVRLPVDRNAQRRQHLFRAETARAAILLRQTLLFHRNFTANRLSSD